MDRSNSMKVIIKVIGIMMLAAFSFAFAQESASNTTLTNIKDTSAVSNTVLSNISNSSNVSSNARISNVVISTNETFFMDISVKKTFIETTNLTLIIDTNAKSFYIQTNVSNSIEHQTNSIIKRVLIAGDFTNIKARYKEGSSNFSNIISASNYTERLSVNVSTNFRLVKEGVLNSQLYRQLFSADERMNDVSLRTKTAYRNLDKFQTNAELSQLLHYSLDSMKNSFLYGRDIDKMCEDFLILGRLYQEFGETEKSLDNYKHGFIMLKNHLRKETASSQSLYSDISKYLDAGFQKSIEELSESYARLLFIEGREREKSGTLNELLVNSKISYETILYIDRTFDKSLQSLTFLKAVIAFNANDKSTVIQSADELNDPKYYDLKNYMLGITYISSLMFDKGFYHLKLRTKVIDPFYINYEKATYYYKEGDYAKAAQFFTRAEESGKSLDKVYYNLGLSYLNRGDVLKARHYFQLSAANNDSYYSAHYALGMLMFESEDYSKAEDYFEISADIVSNISVRDCKINKAHLYNNLALCYLSSKRADISKAKYAAETAIKMDKDNAKIKAPYLVDPRIYETQAKVFIEDEDFAKAYKSFDEAVKVLDKYPEDNELKNKLELYTKKRDFYKKKAGIEE